MLAFTDRDFGRTVDVEYSEKKLSPPLFPLTSRRIIAVSNLEIPARKNNRRKLIRVCRQTMTAASCAAAAQARLNFIEQIVVLVKAKELIGSRSVCAADIPIAA